MIGDARLRDGSPRAIDTPRYIRKAERLERRAAAMRRRNAEQRKFNQAAATRKYWAQWRAERIAGWA